MGRELLTNTHFRQSIITSSKKLQQLGVGWDLEVELTRSASTSRIGESEISQPATTALQIALVDMLGSCGVLPSQVIGHSSGEIAAAYSVGALSHNAAIEM
jgi:acyl transferase domain-containing protein